MLEIGSHASARHLRLEAGLPCSVQNGAAGLRGFLGPLDAGMALEGRRRRSVEAHGLLAAGGEIGRLPRAGFPLLVGQLLGSRRKAPAFLERIPDAPVEGRPRLGQLLARGLGRAAPFGRDLGLGAPVGEILGGRHGEGAGLGKLRGQGVRALARGGFAPGVALLFVFELPALRRRARWPRPGASPPRPPTSRLPCGGGPARPAAPRGARRRRRAARPPGARARAAPAGPPPWPAARSGALRPTARRRQGSRGRPRSATRGRRSPCAAE